MEEILLVFYQQSTLIFQKHFTQKLFSMQHNAFCKKPSDCSKQLPFLATGVKNVTASIWLHCQSLTDLDDTLLQLVRILYFPVVKPLFKNTTHTL